jgi:hypothetical protein
VAHSPRPLVTMVIWMSDHEPDRPSWDCDTCGKPWPCDPAREHLAAYLGRVALAVHMWQRLEDAAGDLRTVAALDLFTRFLSWTRSAPSKY